MELGANQIRVGGNLYTFTDKAALAEFNHCRQSGNDSACLEKMAGKYSVEPLSPESAPQPEGSAELIENETPDATEALTTIDPVTPPEQSDAPTPSPEKLKSFMAVADVAAHELREKQQGVEARPPGGRVKSGIPKTGIN